MIVDALIKKYESCRLESYLDTKGVPTIGWGHTGSDVFYPGQVITQAQADYLFSKDLSTAQLIAVRFPHWYALNEARQAVLTSMTFQMGTKPLYWPVFMAALAIQDYTAAEAAGLDSKWARSDSPRRASEEMTALASGTL